MFNVNILSVRLIINVHSQREENGKSARLLSGIQKKMETTRETDIEAVTGCLA
jgi:hypothetical protein